MRFAKFFFALIFGVVFFITLMKVLGFLLFAGLIFGAVFLIRRAFFGYPSYRGQYSHRSYGYEAQSPNNTFGDFDRDFEQPLNPTWRKQRQSNSFGRRIEVI